MTVGNAKRGKTFEELAREVGADESGAKFERAFKKIAPPKRAAKPAKKKQNKPARPN